MLGFFSRQMVEAVRNRYLQNNRLREAEVCARLATFFRAKADPTQDGQFMGESQRYIEDLVYYHLRALRIDDTKEILGSLIFIERRSKRGAGQMELLLRDYYSAIEEVRSLKLSVLKALLPKDDFNRFSRAALLAWLQEYLVFVGSHHTMLTSYPHLTLQFAVNQPDVSGPHLESERLLTKAQARIIERIDRRQRKSIEKAEAAVWALLCQRYQELLGATPVVAGSQEHGDGSDHIVAVAPQPPVGGRRSGMGGRSTAPSVNAGPGASGAVMSRVGPASVVSSVVSSSLRSVGGQLPPPSRLDPRGAGVARLPPISGPLHPRR